MNEVIPHAARLEGRIRVPGDKSISHRALIIGAIAKDPVDVTGAADAADVRSTIACVRALGADVNGSPAGTLRVTPVATPAVNAHLDAGNSGTTARLLCGVVAGMGIPCTIDGDESLRRRPMARIAEPLSEMGARVTLDDGRLPARFEPRTLRAIRYELPVASAQVKTALLLAGLFADGETVVIEPVPTRDHTERMLAALGVGVTRKANAVAVTGGERPAGGAIDVPGDFSSAAFLICAAAGMPGSRVTIERIGVNPTRTGLLDVMSHMGARIDLTNRGESSGEPFADISVEGTDLRAMTIDDPALVASVIDEIPVIAVAAATAKGTTIIRNAGELRHKESDRIASTAAMLRAAGVSVETFDDGLAVEGGDVTAATFDAHGDHRIAMAAAVAGVVATTEGTSTIEGAEAAGISYPRFFDDIRSLVA